MELIKLTANIVLIVALVFLIIRAAGKYIKACNLLEKSLNSAAFPEEVRTEIEKFLGDRGKEN